MKFLLIFFGAGLEVLKVVRIHTAVCVSIPYGLVHGYGCFGGTYLSLSSPAVGRWLQYILTEASVPTNQIPWSNNTEDYNFES
jgi:hypothetical protein